MKNDEPDLIFLCRRCGWTRSVSSSLQGKRGRCKSCGHVQRIEAAVSSPSIDEPTASPSLSPPAIKPPSQQAPSRRSRSGWRAALRSYGAESSQVQSIAVCLTALSMADLFMTYTLLRTGPRFFESNPVAQWFFARWNMAGMALFKFGVMAGVIALAEIIERHRPGWGRFVLALGCLGAAYAVVTGLRLYLSHA